jgi:hypothetical protein
MAHVIAQQAGYEVMEINARFDIPTAYERTDLMTTIAMLAQRKLLTTAYDLH